MPFGVDINSSSNSYSYFRCNNHDGLVVSWSDNRDSITTDGIALNDFAGSASDLGADCRRIIGRLLPAVTFMLAMSGHSREIVIAVDPFKMSSPIFQFISPIFPDYRFWDVNTWILTALWLSLIGVSTLAVYLKYVRTPHVFVHD